MNLHQNIMSFIEEKLQINSEYYEYDKFCHLITVVNIPYLKTAIYTFSEHLKDENISIDSKFDYLMHLYNKLLREHQVVFLLFNLFETALRSKLAYELSSKYSTQNMDDWLHNENKIPKKIAKVILPKIKEFILQDNGNFEQMSTYEVFDYVMFGDLKSLYFDFWKDLDYLFEKKKHKGHILHEIGKVRFREMLDHIRKARNDIAHHKPLHKSRKKRYKLIEDIEYILLHIGFNLEEAVNNIDPEHKIIKIGYYENTSKVTKLLVNPSKKNLKEIEKLSQYKGIESYFRKEIFNSDIIGWYGVFKEKGYFEKTKFPKSNDDNIMPFWKELPFIERLSHQIELSQSNTLENEIIQIVNNFIDYVEIISSKNIRVVSHNDYVIFKIIQKFQIKNFSLRYIQFIHETIIRHPNHNLVIGLLKEDFIDKILLCDEEIVLKFYNIILNYDVVSEEYSEKIQPFVSNHYMKKILVYSSQAFTSAQAKSIILNSLQTIEGIEKIDKFSLSLMKIPSIEKSTQRRSYNRNFPILIIDFIRDILEKQKPNEMKDIIESLLDSDITVVRRLAIHTINFFFNEYRALFFEYKKENLFNEKLGLLHEIFIFLENQKDNFSKQELEHILLCIENQDFTHYHDRDNYDEHKENWEAYRKRKYLYALKNSKQHIQCLEVFNAYNSVLDQDDEHPAYDVWSSGIQSIVNKSPLTQTEIIDMPIDVLVKYIMEFKEDKSQFDRLTHDGLAEELKLVILSKPNMYIGSLEKFSHLSEHYFYKIIDAYKQCLEQNLKIDILKILQFINRYLEVNKKSEKLNSWYIAYPISELIRELSSSVKEYVIDGDSHILILEVFKGLGAMVYEEVEDEIEDYISHLLNSSSGRMYTTMLEYSLKYARDNKLEENRWLIEIKTLFEEHLISRTSLNIFTALGYYLPNIRFLDNDWLEENFEIIFSSNIFDKYWQAAFTGYLSSSTVDTEFYLKMDTLNIFDSALDNRLTDEYTERMIGYICIYCNGETKLLEKHTMLYKVLKLAKKEHLEYCIEFFNHHGEEENFIDGEDLKELWEELYSQIEKHQYNDLHIKLLEFIALVPAIDSDFSQLINNSIDKLEEMHDYDYWFIDAFVRLLETNTESIAKIYIKLLKKFPFAIHDQKQVEEILEYFYNNGRKREANIICTLYGEYGIDEWTEIYQRYNV